MFPISDMQYATDPLAASGNPTARILVVDDHAGVRAVITSLIAEKFPDCRLLEAESAEHALSLFAAEPPGLVVMDITLPGMNGFEATRRIKQLSPGTQIVMHSSSDQPIYRDASLAAGAEAFVGKGRDSGSLVPVISELLARRRPEIPTT
jgi:DNA-binding NarL/FixJ family response regulator